MRVPADTGRHAPSHAGSLFSIADKWPHFCISIEQVRRRRSGLMEASVATWIALGGTAEAPPPSPEDCEHLEWMLAHPNALRPWSNWRPNVPVCPEQTDGKARKPLSMHRWSKLFVP